eukprot:Gb_34975 [translate_table: standard]
MEIFTNFVLKAMVDGGVEVMEVVTWHHRFGYAGNHLLEILRKEQLVEGLMSNLSVSLGICEGCYLEKQHQHLFPKDHVHRTRKNMSGCILTLVDRCRHFPW